jgi:hypothetical protein
VGGYLLVITDQGESALYSQMEGIPKESNSSAFVFYITSRKFSLDKVGMAQDTQ